MTRLDWRKKYDRLPNETQEEGQYMIEHGFSDPIWMSKRLIEMSNPILLKKAVIEVIEHLEKAHTEGSTPFKIIDRLVQVSSTGKYYAPEDKPEATNRKVISIGEEGITAEQEKEIQDFIDALDGIPSAEKMDADDENNESYEDFLKRYGIPDIRGESDEGEEDEPE